LRTPRRGCSVLVMANNEYIPNPLLDMKRGEPRPDFSAGRTSCPVHGRVALSYIGNERYACWHCAKNQYAANLRDAR
jgi:hypothetical protein